MPPIDYYFSQNSPWSYFGAGRLVKIAEKAGRSVKVYPVMGMDLFAKTGGLPLGKRSPERQAYRFSELKRWRSYLEVELNLEPKYFPVDDTLPSCAVIAAQETGLNALALSQELGRAQWELDHDFRQLSVIKEAATRAKIDLDAMGDLGQYADQYKANTDQAVERGVFGFPSYIVDGEMFWGQDRLDFLARKLDV